MHIRLKAVLSKNEIPLNCRDLRTSRQEMGLIVNVYIDASRVLFEI